MSRPVNWLTDSPFGGVLAAVVTTSVVLILRRGKNGALKEDDTKEICSATFKNQYVCNVGQPHPFTTEKKYGDCIYLDYNATTPIFPEVTAAMLPFITNCFGNPSSTHVFAEPCRNALQTARTAIGELINAIDVQNEVYFTSCGTESDNRAIDIALNHWKVNKNAAVREGRQQFAENELPHVITCFTEHPAIIGYLKYLRDVEKTIRLSVLHVNSEGRIDIQDLRRELRTNTALVTVMHSNNEVGVIQPIREISAVVRQFNQANPLAAVLVHTDAAQSLGKVNVDVQALGVDMLTIVGHKYGAPKGVAALYIRSNVNTKKPLMLVGGGQERGLRGGTENVALAVALGEASRLAREEANAMIVHLLSLKWRLITKLQDSFADKIHLLRFNGPVRANDPREILNDLKILKVMCKQSGTAGKPVKSDIVEQLPNTVSVSFRHAKSYQLLKVLSNKVGHTIIVPGMFLTTTFQQVACSAGSACHSVSFGEAKNDSHKVEEKISDVLLDMKVPADFAVGTLRLSFGRHTTEQEIDKAVACITAAVRAAWETSGH